MVKPYSTCELLAMFVAQRNMMPGAPEEERLFTATEEITNGMDVAMVVVVLDFTVVVVGLTVVLVDVTVVVVALTVVVVLVVLVVVAPERLTGSSARNTSLRFVPFMSDVNMTYRPSEDS